MRVARLTAVLGGLLLSSLAGSAAAQVDTTEQLLACMRGNIPPTVRIQEVEIVSVDRAGGERRMAGRLYGQREDDKVRVMLRIEAPQDLSGASYLIREGDNRDDMYLYLPAINRVRRITGGSGDGQLFGTDLSYNDVKQIQNAFSATQVRPEGNRTIAGREAVAISFSPAPEQESRYDRITTVIDKLSCVALDTEFSEGGEVRKRIKVAPEMLRQAGDYWYAEEAVVNSLEDGTHTRLKVTGVESGEPVAGRYFNPRSFYIGG